MKKEKKAIVIKVGGASVEGIANKTRARQTEDEYQGYSFPLLHGKSRLPTNGEIDSAVRMDEIGEEVIERVRRRFSSGE